MGFALSVRASSKADALTNVTASLDAALQAGTASQTYHDIALTAATALIGEADEPTEGMELVVSMNISYVGPTANGELQPTGTGLGVSVFAEPVTS